MIYYFIKHVTLVAYLTDLDASVGGDPVEEGSGAGESRRISSLAASAGAEAHNTDLSDGVSVDLDQRAATVTLKTNKQITLTVHALVHIVASCGESTYAADVDTSSVSAED